MTVERVRAAWKAQPFLPFRIHMADGRSVFVGHPDYMSMAPQSRIFAVHHAHDDGMDFVDLLLVTAIEVPASEIAVSGN
ncbi:MAG: hypothetical protein U0575_05625 [Phycisphaerales bacterium]